MFVYSLICACNIGRYSAYIPVVANAPLLKGENDGMLQLSGGPNHLDFQGAYAPTKHLGFQGDVWLGFDGRYSLEFAPGFYSFTKNHLCIEIFGGGGVASATTVNEYSYTDFLSQIKYTQKYDTHAPYQYLFIQPTIGFRERIWEIAFAPRISNVFYQDFRYKKYEKDNNYSTKYQLKESVSAGNLSMYAYQPTIVCRVGFRNIKAFFNLSFNTIKVKNNWTIANVNQLPYYHPFLLAIGVHLRLIGLGEKKERKKPVEKKIQMSRYAIRMDIPVNMQTELHTAS